MHNKLKLGLTLFGLGILGILSMLTITFPGDMIPKELVEALSPETLKYLSLIQPSVLLLIAVVIGTMLYDKVNLQVPSISDILKIESPKISFKEQIKFGVLFGIIAGILTTLVTFVFKTSIPQEFVEMQGKVQFTPIARFLYGGITEEILMRFGFMTLLVWSAFKITKNLNDLTYWIGIVLASLLFAIGHFPMVFSVVENPSALFLTFVMLGNSIAGLFFGWLYWRKGLEAAMVAHIMTHVILMTGEIM
ncbi:CAAX protease self-immunity [Zobellia uliginosa]|uniref:CAAX protease self-immunity n=1 Tax=Zobellia uliginosa TaxID=143224 RepID=A0ABY1KNW7_9FLAO|nr:CPBP family intramembrane glutamic endopeptidase [Zobellia uliginosa]SIS47231.1 CAAX protease self-immunity [Zobellia uliginosa]